MPRELRVTYIHLTFADVTISQGVPPIRARIDLSPWVYIYIKCRYTHANILFLLLSSRCGLVPGTHLKESTNSSGVLTIGLSLQTALSFSTKIGLYRSEWMTESLPRPTASEQIGHQHDEHNYKLLWSVLCAFLWDHCLLITGFPLYSFYLSNSNLNNQNEWK